MLKYIILTSFLCLAHFNRCMEFYDRSLNSSPSLLSTECNTQNTYKTLQQLMFEPCIIKAERNAAFMGFIQFGPCQKVYWEPNNLSEVLFGFEHTHCHIKLLFECGSAINYSIPWTKSDRFHYHKINKALVKYKELDLLKPTAKAVLFNIFHQTEHSNFLCSIDTHKGSMFYPIIQQSVLQRCKWLIQDKSHISCDLGIQNQTCGMFLKSFIKFGKLNYSTLERISVDMNQKTDYTLNKEHPLRSLLLALSFAEKGIRPSEYGISYYRDIDLSKSCFWENPENYPHFNQIYDNFTIIFDTLPGFSNTSFNNVPCSLYQDIMSGPSRI